MSLSALPNGWCHRATASQLWVLRSKWLNKIQGSPYILLNRKMGIAAGYLWSSPAYLKLTRSPGPGEGTPQHHRRWLLPYSSRPLSTWAQPSSLLPLSFLQLLSPYLFHSEPVWTISSLLASFALISSFIHMEVSREKLCGSWLVYRCAFVLESNIYLYMEWGVWMSYEADSVHFHSSRCL